MFNDLVIGISGADGSGKDTFFKKLKERLPACKRFALADELKRELQETISKLYGFDILNCSREQKEHVRKFLLFHGNYRRLQTNGRYWIDKIDPLIKADLATCKIIPVITDIRNSHFEKDELSWIQTDFPNHVLVSISRYTGHPQSGVWKSNSNFENQSLAKIKQHADYKIHWPDATDFNDADLDVFVDDFFKWLRKTQPMIK